jgi:hypothetical protein
VLDQEPIGDQAGGQAALVEGQPIGLADRVDLAVEDAVATVDLAAGISEGCRLA